jgi:hypothetical protein
MTTLFGRDFLKEVDFTPSNASAPVSPALR